MSQFVLQTLFTRYKLNFKNSKFGTCEAIANVMKATMVGGIISVELIFFLITIVLSLFGS